MIYQHGMSTGIYQLKNSVRRVKKCFVLKLFQCFGAQYSYHSQCKCYAEGERGAMYLSYKRRGGGVGRRRGLDGMET
jgi:hypothetical protein